MIKKPCIMIIGGGVFQVPIIEISKKQGYKVVVTDKNNDCIGKRYADNFYNVDGEDIEILLEIANKINHLKCIVCTTQTGMKFHSEFAKNIANYFTLNKEILKNCNNKYYFKKVMQKYNISTPYGEILSSLQEIDYKSLRYPLIVKPSDSSSSRGVSLVQTEEKIRNAFEQAKNFSNNVIIEQYIDGEHYRAYMIVDSLNFIECGIVKRIFQQNRLIEVKTQLDLPINLIKKIYEVLYNASKRIGIMKGTVKGDFIITRNNEIFILEVYPNFDDITAAHLLKYPYDFLLQWIKGDEIKSDYSTRFKILKILYSKKRGLLKSLSIRGNDSGELIMRKEIGDYVEKAKNNDDIIGYYYFRNDDQKVDIEVIVE